MRANIHHKIPQLQSNGMTTTRLEQAFNSFNFNGEAFGALFSLRIVFVPENYDKVLASIMCATHVVNFGRLVKSEACNSNNSEVQRTNCPSHISSCSSSNLEAPQATNLEQMNTYCITYLDQFNQQYSLFDAIHRLVY